MNPPEPRINLKSPATPLRMCVACRGFFPKTTLVAVVHNRLLQTWGIQWPPDSPEATRNTGIRLFGRSAYACYNAGCLTLALRAKKFQRALKQACPGDILDTLAESACRCPE